MKQLIIAQKVNFCNNRVFPAYVAKVATYVHACYFVLYVRKCKALAYKCNCPSKNLQPSSHCQTVYHFQIVSISM